MSRNLNGVCVCGYLEDGMPGRGNRKARTSGAPPRTAQEPVRAQEVGTRRQAEDRIGTYGRWGRLGAGCDQMEGVEPQSGLI